MPSASGVDRASMSIVRIDRQPPVRTVRLDAGPRNVLGLEAVHALRDALAPDPEAPVVVLSGRDDGFSAGLDGATLAAGGHAREALLAAMGEVLLAAFGGPTRIVSVCEGHAVAAGAMLLLVSDVRLGAPGRYKIGFTEPGLGMPLPELPALLARARLDARRVHALTVLGQTVGPAEAVDAGFLDAVLDPGALHAAATDRAHEIAKLSEAAYRGSLRSVWGPALARIETLVAEQNARRDAAQASDG
jgi:enoyl-CoA hydratase